MQDSMQAHLDMLKTSFKKLKLDGDEQGQVLGVAN
jgi:hypothetical protein